MDSRDTPSFTPTAASPVVGLTDCVYISLFLHRFLLCTVIASITSQVTPPPPFLATKTKMYSMIQPLRVAGHIHWRLWRTRWGSTTSCTYYVTLIFLLCSCWRPIRTHCHKTRGKKVRKWVPVHLKRAEKVAGSPHIWVFFLFFHLAWPTSDLIVRTHCKTKTTKATL